MKLGLFLGAPIALFLCSCASLPQRGGLTAPPVYPAKSVTQRQLNELPPPASSIAVAVYGFADETGQFKPTDATQTLSRAVSQGGAAMLVKSLEEAGRNAQDQFERNPSALGPQPVKWFTVLEREQFRDLLNERQIIADLHHRYLGEPNDGTAGLPPLKVAGVLLEGGIVGYDSNTHTGGLGAGLLGISLDAKWRQDTVSVYLRAVSVKTGEILASVTASKTITSTALSATVFKYVAVDKLLQSDNGVTTNEPAQLALQEAIDKAVYGLVMEGVDHKLWRFNDWNAGWPSLWRYRQERDGAISSEQAAAALTSSGRRPTRLVPRS